MRMRITLTTNGERRAELATATDVRQEVWSRSVVQVDPDNPLYGFHRDEQGRAYFEFATQDPAQVLRVLQEGGYADRVQLGESPSLPGEECENCGNVAGPLLPTVCPNCDFRDISPCPACHHEVPRASYTPLGSRWLRCPHCGNRVRFRFNEPMFLSDGSFNPPLIVVDEVASRHEI